MSGDEQFEDNGIEFYHQIKSRNRKSKIETVKDKQSPKKDNLKNKKQTKKKQERKNKVLGIILGLSSCFY